MSWVVAWMDIGDKRYALYVVPFYTGFLPLEWIWEIDEENDTSNGVCDYVGNCVSPTTDGSYNDLVPSTSPKQQPAQR
ncbi:hypothetical protein L1887_14848 [Cichorium endivia]|nr:hypothetical protein L1887_14848 [Cichorium endivia]